LNDEIRPKPDEGRGGKVKVSDSRGMGGAVEKRSQTYRKVEAGVVQQTHPYALQAG
jgi:hypothetical protein